MNIIGSKPSNLIANGGIETDEPRGDSHESSRTPSLRRDLIVRAMDHYNDQDAIARIRSLNNATLQEHLSNKVCEIGLRLATRIEQTYSQTSTSKQLQGAFQEINALPAHAQRAPLNALKEKALQVQRHQDFLRTLLKECRAYLSKNLPVSSDDALTLKSLGSKSEKDDLP